ncbi:ATP-binding protein [uncultured Shewanella sp.]|uniref:ATP-binding protein n=1 Tax=uncultured Shewanella sp. TaxID=173975 RepID=UPI002615819A|nr:ATP-binding protein [uncultured Shewanella sp.]
MKNNALIEQDLAWLEHCVEYRVEEFLNSERTYHGLPAAPDFHPDEADDYATFLVKHNLSEQERLILIMALAPEIKPQVFDAFLVKNTHTERSFSEFGGYQVGSFNGFIPDRRTALFVLSGNDVRAQFALYPLFDPNSRLFNQDILQEGTASDAPKSHNKLQLSETALAQLLTGQPQAQLSLEFPAREIDSSLTWSNLVLPASTEFQLKELMAWLKLRGDWQHRAQGRNGVMAQDIYQGYRCLFYGPSGTGKSLTASLLGKQVGLKTYRVDLSQLVSKYIGETEKNLEQVFKQAEANQWLLFFDEAEALFNQRTSVGNANDRSANQQVGYLLQRIETCTTTVILATNLKENIDPAFIRRFQSIVYFPVPDAKHRTRLWRSLFGPDWHFESNIHFNELGQRFDLAGGAMNNVIRYASLMAMQRSSEEILYDDLIEGIRREYAKQHRSLPS